MNELQLKVLNTTPAVVNFNYEEISSQLDEVLKQYEGIIVTEDTVKDGKKVIAELRKGQKSLDEFRKKTKKELTAPVKEFEDKCKELSKKFDEVINPILEQADQFELKRKEEKTKEVKKVIEEVCKLKGLDKLPLDESYLNKSTSLKCIRTELIKVADNILLEQDSHKKNISLIEGKIELANAKYSVTMVKEPYVSMLEYEDIDSVLSKILEDAESLKDKMYNTPKKEAAPVVEPLVKAPSKDEEIFIEIYEIEGDESELTALEEFLNANGYRWSIKD